MSTTVRNVAIVLAIAALIVLIPGGGSGANSAFQAVALAFLAVIGWFAYTQYRQHRVELDSLGATRRSILYVAAGVAVLTMTAEPRLWVSTGGKIAFLLLLAAAGYAAFAVIRSARRY
jgi:ABC-type phosphonate transport system ATPase subunit